MYAMNSDYKIAVACAKRGFYVFPTYGGDSYNNKVNYKIPRVKWKYASTIDLLTIENWWKRWPLSFVGIDCYKSNLVIIDADVQKDKNSPNGVKNLLDLCNKHNFNIKNILHVWTPSGGLHLYFKNNYNLTNKTGCLPPSIDVRGRGGIVVAPFTQLPDGRSYKCELTNFYSDLTDVPDFLIDLIQQDNFEDRNEDQSNYLYQLDNKNNFFNTSSDEVHPAYIEKATSNQLTKVLTAPKGQRNNILFKGACSLIQMINSNWVDKSILNELINVARANGLQMDEITATIKSAFNKVGYQQAPAPVKNEFNDEDLDRFNNVTLDVTSIKKKEITGINEVNLPLSMESYTAIEGDRIISTITGLPINAVSKELESFLSEWISYPPNQYPKGLVGEIAQYIENVSYIPQPKLALNAALSLGSLLTSRGIETPTAGKTTLFTLSVSGTGTGKELPQTIIKNIILKSSLSAFLMAKEIHASSEYLSESLSTEPIQIVISDEIGDKFHLQQKAKNSSAGVLAVYRSLWGTDSYSPSGSKANNGGKTVSCPCLTLWGNTTAKQFFGRINDKYIKDGTLNRFLIFRGNDKAESRLFNLEDNNDYKCNYNANYQSRPVYNKYNLFNEHKEQYYNIINQINEFVEKFKFSFRIKSKDKTFIAKAIFDQESYKLYNNFSAHLEQLRIDSVKEYDLLSRVRENVLRIATIITFMDLNNDYQDQQNYYIKYDTLSYAIFIVLEAIRDMIKEIYENSHATEFEADCKYMLSTIKGFASVGENITITEICQITKNRFRRDYRNMVIDSLVESGCLKIGERLVKNALSTRPVKAYIIC